jgi:hypothetical protein
MTWNRVGVRNKNMMAPNVLALKLRNQASTRVVLSSDSSLSVKVKFANSSGSQD